MNQNKTTNFSRRIDVTVQVTLDADIPLPKVSQFEEWVAATLAEVKYKKDAELNIRIVGKKESAGLNKIYRRKNRSTNVLSFPFKAPDFIKSNALGDLIICAPVVVSEAEKQNKEITSHWAHLVIHGLLHLLGFDHEDIVSSVKMETMEIRIMKKVGFGDPYT